MSSQVLPPPPPPGLNYIEAIKPSLTFLLIITPLAASLVPILVLLIFFSTPASRSQPVFHLNVFSCVLGFVHAILNATVEVNQILHPGDLKKPLYLAEQVAVVISPVLIDTVLLTRVLAFYPRKTTTVMDRAKVLAFPVCAKLARISCEIAWLVKNDMETSKFGSVLSVSGIIWYRNPLILADFSLQVLDNAYCSLFFLYRLRLFDKAGRSGWINRHPTVLSRIRGLFYIALGNFVFPIALNIAQIVLVVSDHSFLMGSYLQVANTYISAIGLVFATVWTTGHSSAKSMSGSTGSTWNEGSDAREPNHRLVHPGKGHPVRFPHKPRSSETHLSSAVMEDGNDSLFEMTGKQQDRLRLEGSEEFITRDT